MIKPNWRKNLTKKEFQHIVETTDSGTKTQFLKNIKAQKELTQERKQCPCIECKHIAQKLNLWDAS